MGRALSATDENGSTLAFALDRGRLSRVTFPARTQVSVDALGNAVQTTASEERVFIPSDLVGLFSDLPPGVGTPANPAPPALNADLQAQFRDGLGQETRFRTDAGGRATEIVDALNRTTTADRNPAGDVVRLVRPNGTQAFFDYDVNNYRERKVNIAVIIWTRLHLVDIGLMYVFGEAAAITGQVLIVEPMILVTPKGTMGDLEQVSIPSIVHAAMRQQFQIATEELEEYGDPFVR